MINAKSGCVLASWLKLLPFWLMIIPGMAARVLFKDKIACADPEECMKYCQNAGGCSNIAFPELVVNLLPVGM